MSMLDKIRPKATKPAVSVADLEAKLVTAEAQAAKLRRDGETFSLLVLQGEPEAEQRYAEISAQLVEVEKQIALIKAAIPAAQRVEAQVLAERRAAVNKSQIASVTQHLYLRDKAAQKFSEHMVSAIAEWRTLCAHSEKALRAAPVEPPFPTMAALVSAGDIHRAISHELHRLGSTPGSLNRTAVFPGASCEDKRLRDLPEKIKPLPEVMHEASVHALRVLTGKE